MTITLGHTGFCLCTLYCLPTLYCSHYSYDQSNCCSCGRHLCLL